MVHLPDSSTSTRYRFPLNNSGLARYAMQSASCTGGPSMNSFPKTVLYVSAKKVRSVERVWRRGVWAFAREEATSGVVSGREEREEGAGVGFDALEEEAVGGVRRVVWSSARKMAVWVMLRPCEESE